MTKGATYKPIAICRRSERNNVPRNPPINVQLGIAEISLQLLPDRKRVIVYFAPNGATLQKKDVSVLIGALQELQAAMP